MKVIHRNNLPNKPPVILTVVAWLLMDRLATPPVVWGIVCTLLGIVWIGTTISILNQESVDIFEDKKKEDHGKSDSYTRSAGPGAGH